MRLSSIDYVHLSLTFTKQKIIDWKMCIKEICAFRYWPTDPVNVVILYILLFSFLLFTDILILVSITSTVFILSEIRKLIENQLTRSRKRPCMSLVWWNVFVPGSRTPFLCFFFTFFCLLIYYVFPHFLYVCIVLMSSWYRNFFYDFDVTIMPHNAN